MSKNLQKTEKNYFNLPSINSSGSTYPKLNSNPPQMKTFGIMIKSSLESDLKRNALMLLLVEEVKFWRNFSSKHLILALSLFSYLEEKKGDFFFRRSEITGINFRFERRLKSRLSYPVVNNY